MRPFVPRPLMRTMVRRVIRPTLNPSVPLDRQRARIEAAAALRVLAPGVRRGRTTIGGRPTEVLTPEGGDSDRAILYLHGGAFVTGSPRTHRALASHIADAADCPVFVIDYRLAPEHPYPAAVDDGVAAFEELSHRFGEVVLAGDSAGGALSVMVARRLRDAGGEVPVALGLISPLIDLTHAGLVLDRDDMLQREWTEFGSKAFAGGRPLAELSPTVDDLHDLPPTVIHVGAKEMLRPDAEWLAEGLRKVGVPVELKVEAGMWHVWHLHAGLFSAATKAARAMGADLTALIARR